MDNIKILLIVLITYNYTFSQYSSPNISIPESINFASPDVASFHKNEYLPTDLHNGKIDVKVPIYNIKSGKINIPISLSYNMSGIKVDEIASSVGLGWNLNASGSIYHLVNDMYDGTINTLYLVGEQTGDINLPYNIGFNRKYFLEQNHLISDQIAIKANVDSALDHYIINAPGLNNSFVIEDVDHLNYTSNPLLREYKSKFIKPLGHKMDNESLKFSAIPIDFIHFSGDEDGNPDLNISTSEKVPLLGVYDFTNFKITNESGLIYNFIIGDIHEERALPVLVESDQWEGDRSHSANINNYILESIYDPSTQQKVSFEYEEYQITTAQSISFSSSANDSTTDNCGFNFIPKYKGKTLYTNEKLIKFPKVNRLKKILFDKGQVEFLYAQQREDYSGKMLTEIIIKDKKENNIINYDFEYSYFEAKEDCIGEEYNRLRLDAIYENSNAKSRLYYGFDYYYDFKLPKRNSYEQDYLGYYNNNGYTDTSNQSYELPSPQPELYFYPNQGKYSILPFAKKNEIRGRKIEGDYSIEANNFSLTGLLKKMTYGTKGISEFEYENHSFVFDGEEYIAGGARIKKQKIDGLVNGSKEIEYIYEKENGTSSGHLNYMPTYGYPNSQITNIDSTPSEWTPFSFTTFNYDKSALELTRDRFITYSRIIEREIGNGKKVHSYNSSNVYPNIDPDIEFKNDCGEYLVNNSGFPGKVVENSASRRGYLKSVEYFDEENNKLLDVVNDYEYKIFSSVPKDTAMPYTKITDHDNDPLVDDLDKYVSESSVFNFDRNMLKRTTTNEYFGDEVVSSVVNYKYDDELPFLKENSTVNTDGEELKTVTTYVCDFENSSNAAIQKLFEQNRLSEVVEKIDYNNDKIVQKQKWQYKIFGLQLCQFTSDDLYCFGEFVETPALEAKYSAMGNNPYDLDAYYKAYNSFGRVNEYYLKDEIPVIIIWSYHHQYPILKIENASYDNLSSEALSLINQSHDNFENSELSEVDLIEKQLGIINHPEFKNSRITAYTYDPLIGIKSIVDPRGETIYYKYNEFNQLNTVLDKDKNIIQQNIYNHKK